MSNNDLNDTRLKIALMKDLEKLLGRINTFAEHCTRIWIEAIKNDQFSSEKEERRFEAQVAAIEQAYAAKTGGVTKDNIVDIQVGRKARELLKAVPRATVVKLRKLKSEKEAVHAFRSWFFRELLQYVCELYLLPESLDRKEST